MPTEPCRCSKDGRHLCALCGQQSGGQDLDLFRVLQEFKRRLGFGDLLVHVPDSGAIMVEFAWLPVRGVRYGGAFSRETIAATNGQCIIQLADSLRQRYKAAAQGSGES